MNCTHCGYIGKWEYGIAPRPSRLTVVICPSCRGLYTGNLNWFYWYEDYQEAV